jgi:serine/threonine protein phosphatase PrpC
MGEAGAVCRCNHLPATLFEEISEGRPVHEYRTNKETGQYELICLTCFGLWDHTATDRLVEMIMKDRVTTERLIEKTKKARKKYHG